MEINSQKFILLSAGTITDDVMDATEIKKVFDTYKELKLSSFLSTSDDEDPMISNACVEVSNNLFNFIRLRVKLDVGSPAFFSRVIEDTKKNLTILSVTFSVFVRALEAYKRQLEKNRREMVQTINDLAEELEIITDLNKQIGKPLRALVKT